MHAVQLLLPRLHAFVFPRRGAHRRCTDCRRLLPLNDSHYHVDRRSPGGFSRRCKRCRNLSDTRYHRPIEHANYDDKIDREVARQLALQIQAARDGLPIPTPTPLRRPMLAIVRPPPPRYCAACDDHYPDDTAACCGCGMHTHRATLLDDAVELDVEADLGRGRARYTGRVDFLLLDSNDGRYDDAVHVTKQIGDAWIVSNADDVRKQFVRLARRVKDAKARRR